MCEMRGHYKHKENTEEIAANVKNSAYEIINRKHATCLLYTSLRMMLLQSLTIFYIMRYHMYLTTYNDKRSKGKGK